MTPIEFFIHGEPIPAPRPRGRLVKPKGGKPFIHIYTPPDDEAWKKAIALAAWKAVGTTLDGPTRVDIEFLMPRPLHHFGTGRNASTLKPGAPHWHTVRPDRDNLDKAVLDALTAAGVFGDDCCVCDGQILKRYPRPGEVPGAIIRLSSLTQQETLQWRSDQEPSPKKKPSACPSVLGA